jgi:TonB family protein
MSALFMAMLLTGAGGVAQAQVHPPILAVPVPPMPPPIYQPLPPPPLRTPPPPPPPPSTPPRRVSANLNTLFSEDDYPAAAMRAEEEGTAGFRLTIATNGMVSVCQVTMSSGSVALDAATCRILRLRARYVPARDRSGRLAEGTDSGRVTWRLPLDYDEGRAGVPLPAQSAFRQYAARTLFTPGDYPEAAFRGRAAGTSIVRLAIGTGGRVVGCAVESGSGSAALDGAACRILTARARYGPARNADGVPACDIDVVRVAWRLPASRPAWAGAGAANSAPGPLGAQLNATLCPGWTEPAPEEDIPPGLPVPAR